MTPRPALLLLLLTALAGCGRAAPALVVTGPAGQVVIATSPFSLRVEDTAGHAVTAAHTAAGLLRCDATALDRYDAADSTDGGDPTAPCAGVAKRLQAETGAGEAAVAPAPPGQ